MSKRALVGIILLLSAGLAITVGLLMLQRPGRLSGSAASTGAASPLYYCPMHPSMTSDRPADCPICQMRMVLLQPEHESDVGLDRTSPPGGGERTRSGGPAESMRPEGLAAVRIAPANQQLVGLTTTPAKRVEFRREIRAAARVTFDETRLHHVHAKVSGYVETLATDTGAFIRKGQPLLEIYSPELLAAQEDDLTALRARDRTAGSSLPSVAASGRDLLESARRRLELLDLSPGEIAELERTGRALRTIAVHAPVTGHVLVRSVTHGERVTPDMALLDIADLSHVWVLASIYEYELPFVHVGQKAVLSLPYLSGQTRKGVVTLVYPTLDSPSRTVQLRLEFPNPDLLLKPEMFGEVVIQSDLGVRLGVPDSAVMDTGMRQVVFVEVSSGVFEPREVTVGLRLADLCEIRAGLTEGEKVVTSANFFLDSESKLRSAFARTPPGQGSTHRH